MVSPDEHELLVLVFFKEPDGSFIIKLNYEVFIIEQELRCFLPFKGLV